MSKVTAAQAAKSRSVSKRRLLVLLAQHRIPHAELIGGIWMLPENFTIKKPPKRPGRKLEKLA